jgi:hypothetical protein
MKHWLLADHILNRIHIHDVARASLREKALAAAIITDKALMLEKAIKPSGASMREEPAGERAGGATVCPETVEAGLGVDAQRRMNAG